MRAMRVTIYISQALISWERANNARSISTLTSAPMRAFPVLTLRVRREAHPSQRVHAIRDIIAQIISRLVRLAPHQDFIIAPGTRINPKYVGQIATHGRIQPPRPRTAIAIRERPAGLVTYAARVRWGSGVQVR